MTSPRDQTALLDAYHAGRRALTFAEGLSGPAGLAADRKSLSAILHELIIMGDAVKRLSEEFRANEPHIPWRNIAGQRNVLIHSYDQVQVAMVWRVVSTDLPEVLEKMNLLLPAPPTADEDGP